MQVVVGKVEVLESWQVLKGRLSGVGNAVVTAASHIEGIYAIGKRGELVVTSLKLGEISDALERVLLTEFLKTAVLDVESLKIAQSLDV